ncbi:MAG TPA: transcriptional regulator [Patescibacteria group bacterium]|nr:transcriptional regulator [Patescibacteria group bacterium]
MDIETKPHDPVAAIASLDEPNRRRLYDFVVGRHEPVGRDEAAAEAGMSRELAAFHLDRLVAAGLLETEYKRLGGRSGPGGGRPAKLYRRSGRDLSVSLPQRDYRRAALLMAEALDELGGSDPAPSRAVADVARARGKADGLEARRNAGPRASRRRLRSALVELLRHAGYAPEVATESGRIGLRSCPFDGLVTAHRDLTCGMNVAWAEGVVDGLGQAGLSARLDPADGFCCVAFDSAPAHRAAADAPLD